MSEQHPGYGSLNRSTVRIMTQAVEANPDGDLEDILKKLLSSYQITRERIDRRQAKKQGKLRVALTKAMQLIRSRAE